MLLPPATVAWHRTFGRGEIDAAADFHGRGDALMVGLMRGRHGSVSRSVPGRLPLPDRVGRHLGGAQLWLIGRVLLVEHTFVEAALSQNPLLVVWFQR